MTAPLRFDAPTVPPLWVGLSLVAWGVLTGHFVLGILLAVVAEFGSFTPVKWELTTAHFCRVADLTSVLFAAIAIYQFNEYSIYGIYRVLALLPVCVFPLLAAERYSTTGALPLSALFLSLRRRVRGGFEKERYVGVGFPFVIVAVLAASASQVSGFYYLAIAFVLVAGAMFGVRSPRYRLTSWLTTLTLIAIVGFAIQSGIRATQLKLEDSFSYWVNQFAWLQTDPRRELTSIGTIGRLKLSDRIRVRFDAPLSIPLPIALREASYSRFNLGMWSAPDGDVFEAIDPLPETTTWELHPAATQPGELRAADIIIEHGQDVGVVPLPYGTQRIDGDELIEIQRNGYGTTLLEALPGQLRYRVNWQTDNYTAPPPRDEDLSIPENYLTVIKQVAQEIGIPADDPVRALDLTRDFFRQHFKYSLIQKGFYPGRTPLAHFLLQERKGHCEYFATSTALLLRYAGIPTRYSVGYMVYEYSELERSFIARARHAHSWVEAYVNDQWIMVDTTPGEWHALESANVSGWQRLQDLWSWITNRYARYQRSDNQFFADLALWIIPLLVIYLLWRLRSRARATRNDTVSPPAGAAVISDSELVVLSRLLEERGYAMVPGDTLRTFFSRHLGTGADTDRLDRLLLLHNRYRFSTPGIDNDERRELRRGCDELGLELGITQ